jgi:hypothetical protein
MRSMFLILGVHVIKFGLSSKLKNRVGIKIDAYTLEFFIQLALVFYCFQYVNNHFGSFFVNINLFQAIALPKTSYNLPSHPLFKEFM